MSLKNTVTLSLLLAGGAWVAGCNQQADNNASRPQAETEVAGHGGWWCDEHGVPEEVCARCDPSLVAGFKAKQDWCEEHARPDSQCFIHHPEKEAEFAAQYEAKYGHKPPKPEPEAGGPAHPETESKT
jgi:hypothetical protein